MKKIISNIAIFMIALLSIFLLDGCGCTNSDMYDIIGLEAECINPDLSMTNKTITIKYNKDKVNPITDADFKVYAIRKNGSKAIMKAQTETNAGYTFISGFGTTAPVVGEYDLRFVYGTLNHYVIKVIVEKGDYDISNIAWDYNIPYTYDGGEKIITLLNVPSNITVVYENNRFANAGIYVANAQLTFPQNSNYNSIQDISVTWEIKKAKIDCSQIVWDYTTSYNYDGSVKTVQLINLPDNVTVKYIDNSASEKGNYVAKAQLIFDETNYELCNFNCSQLNWVIQ